MPANVFMVVNTYAPDDPRVIFSASSLVKMGYSVRLIGAARQKQNEPLSTHQAYQGVQIQIVPHVDSYNPLHLIYALWLLFSGGIPQTMLSRLSQTNMVSLLFFNLWVLRLGLFSKIDVIHCHDLSPLPGCYLLSLLKKKKIIYDIHEDVPSMYAGRKGTIMTWLEHKLVSRVDYVIAAGQRLAEAMKDRGAVKVKHIGNWKPLAEYDVAPEEVARLRHSWQIPDDAFIISFLGTLDPNRELPALLEAVATSPDVYLLIAGRGDHQDLVIDYAQKYDNIRWLVWVDIEQIPLYTIAADALYYCRSEKMKGGSYELAPAPNKLYEAFAAGRPVIARRGVGEIGEILEQIPAGILVEQVNPETVKDAIEQLKRPEIYAEKQAAAYAARDEYNWTKAEQYLSEIYTQLTQ